jgi:hypothetical protein
MSLESDGGMIHWQGIGRFSLTRVDIVRMCMNVACMLYAEVRAVYHKTVFFAQINSNKYGYKYMRYSYQILTKQKKNLSCSQYSYFSQNDQFWFYVFIKHHTNVGFNAGPELDQCSDTVISDWNSALDWGGQPHALVALSPEYIDSACGDEEKIVPLWGYYVLSQNQSVYFWTGSIVQYCTVYCS